MAHALRHASCSALAPLAPPAAPRTWLGLGLGLGSGFGFGFGLGLVVLHAHLPLVEQLVASHAVSESEAPPGGLLG